MGARRATSLAFPANLIDVHEPVGGSEVKDARTEGVASEAARKRVAVEMVAKHERSLRRTARRYSICAADADDAFQRAMEILLVCPRVSTQGEVALLKRNQPGQTARAGQVLPLWSAVLRSGAASGSRRPGR